MATRLSPIATQSEDESMTSLGDGSRVDKDTPRIEAIGAVDELNSWIGFLWGFLVDSASGKTIADHLNLVQHDLFDLSGGLSKPGQPLLSAQHVARLDALAETINADLAPLEEAILPGGHPPTGAAHIARTICRRAERRLIALEDTDPQPSEFALAYLDKLSDVLFSSARLINRLQGAPDLLLEAGKGAKA